MANTLDLDGLRALDAIDKKGSFAAAAESLHKVPSALTYTIQKLEQEFGTPLFDRSKQRAKLTAAGRLVLEQGREILQSTQRLADAVAALESGWERELRIARDTAMPPGPLLEALTAFLALSVPVDISLAEESLGGGWDALHSRRADLVIGANGDLPRGLFETHCIGQLEFVFALAPFHPLAGAEGVLQLEQLMPFPSVVVSDSSQLLPARSSGLFSSRQTLRVASMEAKIELQCRGLGTGFIPRHLAAPLIASGALVEKACALPRPSQPVFLAWHKEHQGKALAWFVAHLCKADWGI